MSEQGLVTSMCEELYIVLYTMLYLIQLCNYTLVALYITLSQNLP